MKRSLLAFVTILLASFALAACAGGSQTAPVPTRVSEGEPRPFALGLSSLPPELTEESYAAAFELAASAGEVVLIQRPPPWGEMLSGDLSDETVETTQREIALAEEHGLDLFIAIDPIDVSAGRSRLTDLPDELRGAGFGDEDVRRAFIAYAQYVAENYRPAYLALGVDVNSYELRRPDDFEQFVTLYHEAYQAVKQLSPETLVFPIFQLEQLKGILPADEPYLPQWRLIDLFEPNLDLVAVSSFPSLVFVDPAHIPATYYTQLASFTDRPIAIAGMGYSSGRGPNSADDSSEEDQARFLREALVGAERLSMPLVVWFVGQDLTFTGEPLFDQLQHIGLLRQDGEGKAAWREWQAAARRPLEAASGQRR